MTVPSGPTGRRPIWGRLLGQRPNLLFWLCFGSLNGLLFLPLLLAGMESAGASSTPAWGGGFPLGGALAAGVAQIGLFHLSAEFTLLVGIWLLLARRPAARSILVVLTPAVYLLTLIYHAYEAIMRAVYQMEPVFYSQYRFIVDGIGFLAKHVALEPQVYAGAAVGGVAGLGLIWLLFRGLGSTLSQGLGLGSRLGLLGLAGLALVSAGMWGSGLAAPAAPVSSLGVKLAMNGQASLQARQQVIRLRQANVVGAYDYGDLWLARRPNIVLIFVESYGSVLYKRPDYALAYTALVDELQSSLGADGWHSASALSNSPTWGGGSWMAYTSALFGLGISQHPHYLALLDRFQDETYPGLGIYLKAQGYRFVWLSTVSKELKDTEWARYKQFYGVDEWLRYRDLAYTGPRYGWGPAPPDQFALHAVREGLQMQPDPYLLFFITQNSHYPWAPLPALAADWRTLNDPAPDPVAGDLEEIAHTVRRQNYWRAIDNQLRMLTDFILTESDPDTLFILVGDHQPPRVSRHEDGYETPIHVISRDPGWVERFVEVGFAPGLRLGEPGPDGEAWRSPPPLMGHEGLYSLLVRTLLAEYGLPPAHLAANLPDFLPNGVQLDTLLDPDLSESLTGKPDPAP